MGYEERLPALLPPLPRQQGVIIQDNSSPFDDLPLAPLWYQLILLLQEGYRGQSAISRERFTSL
mgnify:CR=1